MGCESSKTVNATRKHHNNGSDFQVMHVGLYFANVDKLHAT